MSNISNVIVSHQPNFNRNRNWTLNWMRHVHVLLSCISEFTIDFIEDVEQLAKFCPKSFSWSCDSFNNSYVSHLGDPGAVSQFQVWTKISIHFNKEKVTQLPLLFEVKGPFYEMKDQEMYFSGTNMACFTHLYIFLFISLLIHFIVLIKTRVSRSWLYWPIHVIIIFRQELTRYLYVFYWSRDYLTGNRPAQSIHLFV